MIGRLKSKVQFSTHNSIFDEGLQLYLHDTKKGLFQIGNALNQQYFAYS
jgi:uncharacterized alpha-E superfamily protein